MVLIDGDILVYSAGFSVQKTIHQVRRDGELIEEFPYMTDLMEWVSCRRPEYINSLSYDSRVEVEPKSHAYQNLNQMVNKILSLADTEFYRVYLTGTGNFREEVATMHEYKGNRDKFHKPVYYQDLIKFLIEYHNAVIVEGIEADDALGIMQCGAREETWIATKDKDLRMIPGNHIDMNTWETFHVTPEAGIRFFYHQLLTGDPTDNIKGVPGIGEIRASRILTSISGQKELFLRVAEEYKKVDWSPLTPKEAMLENGKLLWILRNPEGYWEFPFEWPEDDE